MKLKYLRDREKTSNWYEIENCSFWNLKHGREQMPEVRLEPR